MINEGANGFLISFNDLHLHKNAQGRGGDYGGCEDYLLFEYVENLSGYNVNLKAQKQNGLWVDFFRKYLCGAKGYKGNFGNFGHYDDFFVDETNYMFKLEGVKKFTTVSRHGPTAVAS